MPRPMKNSGVEWLGDIPAHWKLTKGKYLFRQRNEKGNDIELQLLSPTQKYGVIPQQLYEKLSGMTAVKLDENADYSALKSIYEGDFCISLRSFQGGFEYSKYNGVVSPAYQVFYKIADLCDDYYRYMFKDSGFISKMTSYTKTFRDGKSISFTDFANSIIPMPPLEEQQHIATFLDGKCARIDSVIEKTRLSIEEYKKLKQALITRAVTKGIRPARPMKHSGVEWIGDIPAGWKLVKLKHILQQPLQYGANQAGIPYDSTLPRYIRITDITTDGQLKNSGVLSLSEEDSKGYILQDNDILFARSGATVGKAFIYKKEYGRAAFAGYLIKASLDKKILPKLLFYYAQSSIYDEWKKQIFIQSTIENIGADRYREMPIILPPLEEQKEIARYLDEKTAAIDLVVGKKNQLVTELERLKKSLIFEYVTGKKEIAMR